MEQTGLVILIVVMGGGIAYVADKVGKHLGKKRLSLFGLRPRHTAAVGTILLGAIITLFTLAVIFALSSGVRTWVIQGPGYLRKVNGQLDEIRGEVKKSEGRNKQLSKANGDLTKRTGEMSGRLAKGEAALRDEQSKYGDLQGKTVNLRGQISGLNQKVLGENDQIRKLGSAERDSEKKLNSVRAQQNQAEQILKTSTIQKNEALRANLDLVNKNIVLTQQQSTLQTEIKNLQTQREAAQGELKSSQEQLNQSKRELGDVEAQLGDVELKLKDTLAKLENAKISADFANYISRAAFNQPLTYSKGEEIVRLPVRGNLSANAARNEITTLIRTARVDAERKGAKGADVYVHDDEHGNPIAPQELEQQLASQIAGIAGNQVLIACSSYNAFKTENVSLEILVKPNPIVFAAGQMIAETPIDANKGERVVIDEISAFLRDKVRPKALSEGLIPPINSDVSIGEVSLPDLLTLVPKIRNTTSRQVRLQALAEGTTRAADSLRLAFRIR